MLYLIREKQYTPLLPIDLYLPNTTSQAELVNCKIPKLVFVKL